MSLGDGSFGDEGLRLDLSVEGGCDVREGEKWPALGLERVTRFFAAVTPMTADKKPGFDFGGRVNVVEACMQLEPSA